MWLYINLEVHLSKEVDKHNISSFFHNHWLVEQGDGFGLDFFFQEYFLLLLLVSKEI